MAAENRDLKAEKSARLLVSRLWAGGERSQAITAATKAKLPDKEWPEGMAEHKWLIENNN